MKTFLKLFQKPILLLLLAFGAIAARAQDETAALQHAIEAKHFLFEVQTILPTSGVARQATGERYQIRVNGDSLTSDLPYFGRAYSVPLNGEAGIHFTSTQFDYSYKARKKSWDVSIKPKDATDLREFVLNIGKSGYATLRALSNNKQPITYNGVVHVLQQ